MYRSSFAIKRQFDFDIGHLKKSPCKNCLHRSLFPGCADTCEILDRIQTRLARSIATTHTHSPLEPYTVYLEDWQAK
ncbi:MAG: hypothetical protein P8X96_23845 [Desulfobacteraceae bacterium]